MERTARDEVDRLLQWLREKNKETVMRNLLSENATSEDCAGSLLFTSKKLTSLTSDFGNLQIGQNSKYGEKDEKSVSNPSLIQEALNDSYAASWQKTNAPCALIPVSEDSMEYLRVNCQFSSTSRGMRITKLERVENPYLLAQYLLKKEQMRKKGLSVREISLFHGTRRLYVDGICKYNFDWRRCGTSRGHKFGRGVSFTPEVSYARHYTFGNNVMILAKVLVAKSTIGNMFTVVPPEPYDTAQNGKGTVVVKFEDHDFFPQYVIHYV